MRPAQLPRLRRFAAHAGDRRADAAGDGRIGDPLGPLGATPDHGDLALTLSGGGARGAYQLGLLRYLADRYPALRIPILVGVSAGAVNAAYLAQHQGTFPEAVHDLTRFWGGLTPEQVFRVRTRSLIRTAAGWGFRLVSGRGIDAGGRGVVDTAPLQALLERAFAPRDGELAGVAANLRRGVLRAVAISTTSFTTGQSVIWVQGRDVETWERPKRRSVTAPLRVEHVMASAALPLFFPAVRVGDEWHGDGGIRLTAPLSPALHLGAHKLLVVSTRYQRSEAEAARPGVSGYPPLAQILGVLYNAIFLDLVDQDVLRLERTNRLLAKLPPDDREGLRVVRMLVLRPSRDLGLLAGTLEPRFPDGLRLLTRGSGAGRLRSPDILSMLMFQDDYVQRLIALGEEDAAARAGEIEDFLGAEARAKPARRRSSGRKRVVGDG